MKKRILLRLVSLGITAAILFSCGGQLLAAPTDEASYWGKNTDGNAGESAVESSVESTIEGADKITAEADERSHGIRVDYDIDFDFNNDYLAEQYIMQKMSLNKQAYQGTYDFSVGLTGDTLTIYEYIMPYIKEMAAGTRTSTEVLVPADLISYEFSYEELGITAETDDVDEIDTAIYHAVNNEDIYFWDLLCSLLYSCPYDLYWYDKLYALWLTFPTEPIADGLKVSGVQISFVVEEEYAGDKDFTIDPKYGQAVTASTENAKRIIAANADKDDYSKLLAYADAICDLTDYNYEAVEDESTPYGNPWQMIWVFDGDDTTDVVCEGYSKAFHYLCDNTAFEDDNIYAISVYGYVEFSTGSAGGHMWNLVHMDDGKNYHVDTTVMDCGAGNPNDYGFFLKGATSQNDLEYWINNEEKYVYDDDYHTFFDQEDILLASKDYEYGKAIDKYSVRLGDQSANCDPELPVSFSAEGNNIKITVNPSEGFEFDYITVNGTKYYVPEFRMPAGDVVVNVYCKKIVTGWVQDESGNWYFINEDFTKATGWMKDGAWYYFDRTGVMQTGWQKIGGIWYYFRNSGSMYSSSWLKWGSSWYYLTASGAMATGWQKIGGTWYLFSGSGVMLTGWQKDGSKWYYLDPSGAMHTGWLKSGGKWYYLNASGDMATGWLKSGEYWYYLDPVTGAMVTGSLRIDGKRYRFDDDGHCLNP